MIFKQLLAVYRADRIQDGGIVQAAAGLHWER